MPESITYFNRLDGLRFFAAFAVLVHHLASFLSTFVDWGYYGVDLFFVISGFLITRILLKNNDQSFFPFFKTFMIRRVLRIFPLYYLLVLLFVFVQNKAVVENSIYLFTYTFNYVFPFLSKEGFMPLGHFWSLGVEEQFYVFWPVLVFFVRKNMLLLRWVTAIMVCYSFLQVHFSIIPEIAKWNYAGLPARMGSLGLGALGAMFLWDTGIKKSLLEKKYWELIFGGVLVFALLKHIPVLMSIASLFLVLKSTVGTFQYKWINTILSHKKITYLGTISYGLYVYHVPILLYSNMYFFDSFWMNIPFDSWGKLSVLKYHAWLLKLPLYTLVTIAIASLSYRFFEMPFLRLKNHFSYKQKT